MKTEFLFFSFSDLHQSHHFVGWHATDINLLLIYFLNALHCLKFYAKQLVWMDNSFRIIFIKVHMIKVNIIKIYTKNTHQVF